MAKFVPSVSAHQGWENRRPTPPLPQSLVDDLFSAELPSSEPSKPDTPKVLANLAWRTNAVDAAKLDIFTTLTRSCDDKAPKTATLNIAAAQRLIVANWQRKIAIQVAELYNKQLSRSHLSHALSNLSKFTHAHCKLVSCGQAEHF